MEKSMKELSSFMDGERTALIFEADGVYLVEKRKKENVVGRYIFAQTTLEVVENYAEDWVLGEIK